MEYIKNALDWATVNLLHALMVVWICSGLIVLCLRFWPVGDKAKFYSVFGVLPDANPQKVDQMIRRVFSELKKNRDYWVRKIGEYEVEIEKAQEREDAKQCKRMADYVRGRRLDLRRQEREIRRRLQLAMRFHAESTKQLIVQLELGEIFKEDKGQHEQS